jgi:hypothetical protein
MRYWRYLVFTALILASPAAAQPAGNDSKTAASTSQDQAAKDSKTTAQTGTDQSKTASDSGAQGGRTDSMSDYNVNGNAVGDGMGVSR